jgi:heterodisulfide reductase subunit C
MKTKNFHYNENQRPGDGNRAMFEAFVCIQCTTDKAQCPTYYRPNYNPKRGSF